MNRPEIISLILDASAKPLPEIVESKQLLCDDGQWRSAMGIPHGVSAVKPFEVRTIGFVFRSKEGSTYGKRHATAEDAKAFFAACEAKNREEFRIELEKMTDERIESQASFWLKTA